MTLAIARLEQLAQRYGEAEEIIEGKFIRYLLNYQQFQVVLTLSEKPAYRRLVIWEPVIDHAFLDTMNIYEAWDIPLRIYEAHNGRLTSVAMEIEAPEAYEEIPLYPAADGELQENSQDCYLHKLDRISRLLYQGIALLEGSPKEIRPLQT